MSKFKKNDIILFGDFYEPTLYATPVETGYENFFKEFVKIYLDEEDWYKKIDFEMFKKYCYEDYVKYKLGDTDYEDGAFFLQNGERSIGAKLVIVFDTGMLINENPDLVLEENE